MRSLLIALALTLSIPHPPTEPENRVCPMPHGATAACVYFPPPVSQDDGTVNDPILPDYQ